MAFHKQVEQDQALSVGLEWSICNFSKINWFWSDSPEYNFSSDQKFVLRVRQSVTFDYRFFACFLNTITSTLSLNCKLSFIDLLGEKTCTVIKRLKIEESYTPYFIIEMDGKELNSDFVAQDTLTIRCTLSAEEYKDSQDCETQTDEPLFLDTSHRSIEQASQTDKSTTLDKSSTHFFETLSTDFETFYENRTDTDCILNAGNENIEVHRAVLSARSKVFAAMFQHDTTERRTGEVNIHDIEASILRDLVYFIYTGKIRGLTGDTAVPMYAAADKYAVLELRETCMEFLLHNIEIDNICDAAILAYKHGEIVLEKRVIHFIVQRFDEVEESDGWRNLLATNALLAMKLMSAAFRTK